jgi:hypothetical protein
METSCEEEGDVKICLKVYDIELVSKHRVTYDGPSQAMSSVGILFLDCCWIH